MIYKNILNAGQLSLIGKLKDLPAESYMAGGTALALQLGHRTSLDFDFYSPKHFDVEVVLAKLQKDFQEVKIQSTDKDTLLAEIDNVSFSLFYYPYSMVEELVEFETTKLASLKDIAAMKMIAISIRGKRRDFIDSYYLIKKYGLPEIMELTLKKYPAYQPMVILKGLTYFEDAEAEDIGRNIQIFDKNFSWEIVKKAISMEVEKYQRSVVGL